MRLTGEVAVDPSTAALALPLFDLARLEWVHDAFNRVHDTTTGAGVTAAQMPPLRRSHEVLGAVTAEAARATGLRAGTPVVVGGGDFAAATLGAGVVAEGEACLMLGTAGNLLVPRKTPGTDARLINAHHVGRSRGSRSAGRCRAARRSGCVTRCRVALAQRGRHGGARGVAELRGARR